MIELTQAYVCARGASRLKSTRASLMPSITTFSDAADNSERVSTTLRFFPCSATLEKRTLVDFDGERFTTELPARYETLDVKEALKVESSMLAEIDANLVLDSSRGMTQIMVKA